MEEPAKAPATEPDTAPAAAPSAGSTVSATGETTPAVPVGGTTTKDGRAQVTKDVHIKVYSPFKVYFDDRATSISAVNDTGPFDILPGHRNFMTLVSACELVIRSEKGEDKIKIARAVMHVKANDIVVFLDV